MARADTSLGDMRNCFIQTVQMSGSQFYGLIRLVAFNGLGDETVIH